MALPALFSSLFILFIHSLDNYEYYVQPAPPPKEIFTRAATYIILQLMQIIWLRGRSADYIMRSNDHQMAQFSELLVKDIEYEVIYDITY